MEFLTLIDILGTIAFAISGVLKAMDKRLDVFGVFIIALVTSVGGGTLRDLLIGKTPVTWMLDMTFVYLIIATVILAIVFRNKLQFLGTSLLLFDTIGIALYTVVGVQMGAGLLHPIICVALGTMTACFGGVLRDILCNEVPVLFQREIYATACIAGGTVYLVLERLGVDSALASIVAGSTVITIRLLAVHFKLSLPSIYRTT
ncbi:trimeric intracellular cation channel family protein [Croceiramulus getboli]|nr:trimeric intracellular cation channel family protein [Flavobacteriaceae bacterium YJPT1-3]